MALFERNKNIRADLIEDGLLKIEISMIDNVHQISTTYRVAFPSKIIKYAEADFKRAPYLEVCRQVRGVMSNLGGLKIDNGFTRKAIRAVGGKNGCYHLLDQVLEMAKALSQFIDRSINLPLAEYIDDTPKLREKVLEIYPGAKNMCFAYNIKNNHLVTKDIKCGLKESLII